MQIKKTFKEGESPALKSFQLSKIVSDPRGDL